MGTVAAQRQEAWSILSARYGRDSLPPLACTRHEEFRRAWGEWRRDAYETLELLEADCLSSSCGGRWELTEQGGGALYRLVRTGRKLLGVVSTELWSTCDLAGVTPQKGGPAWKYSASGASLRGEVPEEVVTWGLDIRELGRHTKEYLSPGPEVPDF